MLQSNISILGHAGVVVYEKYQPAYHQPAFNDGGIFTCECEDPSNLPPSRNPYTPCLNTISGRNCIVKQPSSCPDLYDLMGIKYSHEACSKLLVKMKLIFSVSKNYETNMNV